VHHTLTSTKELGSYSSISANDKKLVKEKIDNAAAENEKLTEQKQKEKEGKLEEIISEQRADNDKNLAIKRGFKKTIKK